ncbi:hypothetical protein HID58_074646 [Brassica napus]|nr:hypothetical protein HID58_074646 [Brassica napus]CDY63712.1 BnaCnng42490D [Brassica napus]
MITSRRVKPTKRDWQQVEQALLGHSLSSSEAASSMKRLSCPLFCICIKLGTTNLRIFGVRMRRQRQVQVWFQCFLEMVNMSCLLF